MTSVNTSQAFQANIRPHIQKIASADCPVRGKRLLEVANAFNHIAISLRIDQSDIHSAHAVHVIDNHSSKYGVDSLRNAVEEDMKTDCNHTAPALKLSAGQETIMEGLASMFPSSSKVASEVEDVKAKPLSTTEQETIIRGLTSTLPFNITFEAEVPKMVKAVADCDIKEFEASFNKIKEKLADNHTEVQLREKLKCVMGDKGYLRVMHLSICLKSLQGTEESIGVEKGREAFNELKSQLDNPNGIEDNQALKAGVKERLARDIAKTARAVHSQLPMDDVMTILSGLEKGERTQFSMPQDLIDRSFKEMEKLFK